MDVTFITDPLVTTAGSVRPALLLARAFREKGHNVTIVSTQFAEQIIEVLSSEGITIQEAGPSYSLHHSFPTLEAWAKCMLWLREADKSFESDFIVNTSSCIISPCHVYYAQGPMTRTLSDILLNKHSLYSCVYRVLEKPATFREKELIRRFRESARGFVANSRFCASMYEEWGISVDEIINPPMDCSFFKPSTSNPTRDYVLTTIGTYGKEGDFLVVKAIADAGIRTKVFGDVSSVPHSLKTHPSINLLGRVSNWELRELYSNALYTLFAFSHEPFGYVPVESMACGTPVLTFNRQGPSETMIDGETGWLVNSSQELLALALKYWREGYRTEFRKACRERALMFDTKKIFDEWSTLLKKRPQTS